MLADGVQQAARSIASTESEFELRKNDVVLLDDDESQAGRSSASIKSEFELKTNDVVPLDYGVYQAVSASNECHPNQESGVSGELFHLDPVGGTGSYVLTGL